MEGVNSWDFFLWPEWGKRFRHLAGVLWRWMEVVQNCVQFMCFGISGVEASCSLTKVLVSRL